MEAYITQILERYGFLPVFLASAMAFVALGFAFSWLSAERAARFDDAAIAVEDGHADS
ncbi:hypothetical protein [Dolichospermum phage Dfl-JY45]